MFEGACLCEFSGAAQSLRSRCYLQPVACSRCARPCYALRLRVRGGKGGFGRNLMRRGRQLAKQTTQLASVASAEASEDDAEVLRASQADFAAAFDADLLKGRPHDNNLLIMKYGLREPVDALDLSAVTFSALPAPEPRRARDYLISYSDTP